MFFQEVGGTQKERHMGNGLTARQREFARHVASGMPTVESYKAAGYSANAEKATLRKRSSELANNPKVAKEIRRLQKLVEKKMILSQEQRSALLTELAVDKEKATADRIRAVDVLNKMSGVYNGMMVGVQVTLDDKRAAVLAALNETEI